MQRLCVFCGSAVGNQPVFREAAEQLGALLVERDIGLVFGGGHIGLMGVVADAVLAGKGEVIGVIPRALQDKELAHPNATQMHIVDTMHARKALMADLSDGFIALPGGFGTADELFEILTWRQLKIHNKPIGILNVAGFFEPMLAWLDHMMDSGFVKPKNRQLLTVEQDAVALLDRLHADGHRKN